MKRSPIKKISLEHKGELALRRLLKWQLYQEQEGKCKQCQRFLSYLNEASPAYPHLSHKERLSKGKKTGATTRENCSVLCAECHGNKEHNLRLKYNEQPNWSKNT